MSSPFDVELDEAHLVGALEFPDASPTRCVEIRIGLAGDRALYIVRRKRGGVAYTIRLSTNHVAQFAKLIARAAAELENKGDVDGARGNTERDAVKS